jgi:hypothetical protein
MRKLKQGKLSVFKFESFKKFKNISHFVTTKEGWEAGDKPRFTGDEETIYSDFRKELAVSCKSDPDQFVFPRQVHSDHIVVVDSPESPGTPADTDALITNRPGIFVCVQTADCVPVLLFDPVRNVVAAVHAGWRGTVSKIAGKTVKRMQDVYDCNPADILAGIGPSIHMHSYEVGREVVEAVEQSFSNYSALLQPSMAKGKAFLDLWEANKTVLLEAGLQEDNIEIMGLCSYQHNDLFFSARRDGSDTGRMVSGIRLV